MSVVRLAVIIYRRSETDIKEQDYSLNPGRYVGVVIEEDGKTEEEFIEGLADMQSALELLDTDF